MESSVNCEVNRKMKISSCHRIGGVTSSPEIVSQKHISIQQYIPLAFHFGEIVDVECNLYIQSEGMNEQLYHLRYGSKKPCP